MAIRDTAEEFEKRSRASIPRAQELCSAGALIKALEEGGVDTASLKNNKDKELQHHTFGVILWALRQGEESRAYELVSENVARFQKETGLNLANMNYSAPYREEYSKLHATLSPPKHITRQRFHVALGAESPITDIRAEARTPIDLETPNHLQVAFDGAGVHPNLKAIMKKASFQASRDEDGSIILESGEEAFRLIRQLQENLLLPPDENLAARFAAHAIKYGNVPQARETRNDVKEVAGDNPSAEAIAFREKRKEELGLPKYSELKTVSVPLASQDIASIHKEIAALPELPPPATQEKAEIPLRVPVSQEALLFMKPGFRDRILHAASPSALASQSEWNLQ